MSAKLILIRRAWFEESVTGKNSEREEKSWGKGK